MTEKWINILNDVPLEKYELIEVIQNGEEGTLIMLEGEEHRLFIRAGITLSFMVSEEGTRQIVYNETEELDGYVRDFVGSPLYEVEHSEFLEWILRQSGGLRVDLRHFVVITQNHVIDIATYFDLDIEVEKLN